MRDERDRGHADAAPAGGAPACRAPTLDITALTSGAAPAPRDGTPHGTWKLGTFTLCRVFADSARFGRTAAQIRRDLLDDWLISVTGRGVQAIRDGDAVSLVPPSVPVVLSLGAPFETEFHDAEWLCLAMPRDSCPELTAAMERCRAAPLASAPGRLLGGFLQRLGAELPRMREAEIPRAVEATRALVAAAVSAGATPGLVDEATVRAARLARVRAVIHQHLRSPDLNTDWLCRVVGMSRSELYRLFEPVGGVMRDVQRERLRQAHRAIADPNDARTIQQISEDLAFSEPTTFSRAFRREFGYPPGALRRGFPSAPISANDSPQAQAS